MFIIKILIIIDIILNFNIYNKNKLYNLYILKFWVFAYFILLKINFKKLFIISFLFNKLI